MEDSPHPTALSSSALLSAHSTRLVVPLGDEITPTMTRQTTLAESGLEGAESTTRVWSPDDEDEIIHVFGMTESEDTLHERVQEASAVAADNSNNRMPAGHVDRSEDRRQLEDSVEDLSRELARLVVGLADGQNRTAKTIAYMLTAFLPFALLFLFKFCFESSVAIFSILPGYMVFLSADSNVTCLASNNRGSIFSVLFVVAAYYLSIVNVIGLSLQPILDGLTMQIQMYQGCLVTLYYVIMTDLAAKHITVALKGLLVSLPASIMVEKRRRRLCQFLEYCSQTYRAAIAAPWWFTYLLGPCPSTEIRRGSLAPYVDLVLAIIYMCIKFNEVFDYSRRTYRSFLSILNLASIGVRPTQEEIANHPVCSICYENMRCPVKLSCNHILCEQCTEKWITVKQNCPMCRAPVEELDSSFFDASTCKAIRIY